MQFSVVPYSRVKKVCRTDAEFFHPKYEIIARCVQSYSEGSGTLGNLVKVDSSKYEPKKKQTCKYIEIANVNGGEITGCTKEEGRNLPARARRKVSTGDVIVSSVEGSLDSIALVGSEYDNALCSTGFHVIKSGGGRGGKCGNLTHIFAERNRAATAQKRMHRHDSNSD